MEKQPAVIKVRMTNSSFQSLLDQAGIINLEAILNHISSVVETNGTKSLLIENADGVLYYIDSGELKQLATVADLNFD